MTDMVMALEVHRMWTLSPPHACQESNKVCTLMVKDDGACRIISTTEYFQVLTKPCQHKV